MCIQCYLHMIILFVHKFCVNILQARAVTHTVLPTHYHFVCPQALCEHSASKSCYPSATTKVFPVSRKYKKQSNHNNSRSSKMQSPERRSVNPRKMQSAHMWPVTAESKTSKLSPKLQVQNKQIRDTKTEA